MGTNGNECLGCDRVGSRGCEGAYLIVAIEDDAMAPVLQHGDEVAVMRCATVVDDGLYAIDLDGGVRVRRFSRDPHTALLAVVADNPAWPSFRAIEPNRLIVVGKVAWLGRKV